MGSDRFLRSEQIENLNSFRPSMLAAADRRKSRSGEMKIVIYLAGVTVQCRALLSIQYNQQYAIFNTFHLLASEVISLKNIFSLIRNISVIFDPFY